MAHVLAPRLRSINILKHIESYRVEYSYTKHTVEKLCIKGSVAGLKWVRNMVLRPMNMIRLEWVITYKAMRSMPLHTMEWMLREGASTHEERILRCLAHIGRPWPLVERILTVLEELDAPTRGADVSDTREMYVMDILEGAAVSGYLSLYIGLAANVEYAPVMQRILESDRGSGIMLTAAASGWDTILVWVKYTFPLARMPSCADIIHGVPCAYWRVFDLFKEGIPVHEFTARATYTLRTICTHSDTVDWMLDTYGAKHIVVTPQALETAAAYLPVRQFKILLRHKTATHIPHTLENHAIRNPPVMRWLVVNRYTEKNATALHCLTGTSLPSGVLTCDYFEWLMQIGFTFKYRTVVPSLLVHGNIHIVRWILERYEVDLSILLKDIHKAVVNASQSDQTQTVHGLLQLALELLETNHDLLDPRVWTSKSAGYIVDVSNNTCESIDAWMRVGMKFNTYECFLACLRRDYLTVFVYIWDRVSSTLKYSQRCRIVYDVMSIIPRCDSLLPVVIDLNQFDRYTICCISTLTLRVDIFMQYYTKKFVWRTCILPRIAGLSKYSREYEDLFELRIQTCTTPSQVKWWSEHMREPYLWDFETAVEYARRFGNIHLFRALMTTYASLVPLSHHAYLAR